MLWPMLCNAWTGMRLTCPSCRQGRIYRSWTRINPSCPRCGVVFEREEGDFVGAMLLSYSFTAVLICIGIYAVEVWTDLAPMAHAALWTALGTAFLVGTYRNMKGMWIGILHTMVGLKRSGPTGS